MARRLNKSTLAQLRIFAPFSGWQRGQTPPLFIIVLMVLALLAALAFAFVEKGPVVALFVIGFVSLAALGTWFEAHSAKAAAQQAAKETESMLANSVGWDYEQCRAEARRVMDALHPGLEFIGDAGREALHGWVFDYGIPTGDPARPWDYLIGCENSVFINRHTGKAEAIDDNNIAIV